MSHDLDENRVIGELLIAKGIVSRDQVTAALFIQSEKPHLRIGEILLSMGLISMEQLDRILREHLSQQFIGSLLLSYGFINQEQLAAAMALRERTNRKLGELLVELGYVTQFQLDTVLERQKVMRRPLIPEATLASGYLKRTKLIATLGPSCQDEDTVRRMVELGVNLFRLNFSHGKAEEHEQHVERVRRVARALRKTIGIIQDIQGPKIRIGEVRDGQVALAAGARFSLVTEPLLATEDIASVTYPRLTQDIKPGATVLIDDGHIELLVDEVQADRLVATVRVGGTLKPRKGVNFPGSPLGISILTDKDREDLVVGGRLGVDWIAASFVQKAEDIAEVKRFLSNNGYRTPVIAKIERREAVYALQEILAVADGVMVARGDLGVECNAEDVPLIQKQIIRQARIAGKPAIIATQMLDSMISSPRPTRAEASDVANAIFDGTDAVMLSNETAAGKYPIEAVDTMRRIIEKTEQIETVDVPRTVEHQHRLSEAITSAATRLADEVKAAAILVPSYRGATARMVSGFRPHCNIVATSSNYDICRQMTLYWGVYPLQTDDETEGMVKEATIANAVQHGLLKEGDLIVIMDAVPGAAGTTRGVRVAKVKGARGAERSSESAQASSIKESIANP